jgi:hypothetical protein
MSQEEYEICEIIPRIWPVSLPTRRSEVKTQKIYFLVSCPRMLNGFKCETPLCGFYR